ncbi:SCO7613 C-terminal domain-containing membrane protein [Streptomyces sp. NRRL S-87]|uniref:SCO7613 C-terminal domain-containing membrane protein n=1 Tax=Streptomyces sp. NRRL S-87 TaxID=1463920 RepID=UPI000A64C126|nr:hypothetical protein [Streptomyces sp. NRRL S-87]
MERIPPPAEELVLIDQELVRLDARRAQLLARRAWLVSVLHQAVAPQPPFPTWSPRPAAAGPAGMAAAVGAPGADREVSGPSAQNVLLALGAVLLAVAAFAFTVVSWGSMGIGGRAAVLGAVTAAALAAPVVLLRRGLRSTAESVAALGMALTVLDAYALYAVALPDTDGTAYAAGSAGVLAALWAGYGSALRGLRLPLPAAVLTAQLPLPLAAVAAGAPPLGVAWALLGTAVLDAVATLRAPGRPARVLAGACGVAVGGWALFAGLVFSASAAAPASAVAPGALLLAGAALALGAAFRATPRPTGAGAADAAAKAGTSDAAAGALGVPGVLGVPAGNGAGAGRVQGAAALAVVAGLAAVAALGGVVRAALPEGWAAVAYLLCAVPLLGLGGLVRSTAPVSVLPTPVRRGLAGAGAGVAALAGVSALPALLVALLSPAEVLGGVWEGRAPSATGADWTAPTAAAVVLLAVAGLAARLFRVSGRSEAAAAAVALGWAGLFLLPLVAALPHPAVLAWHVLLTVAATGLALRAPEARAALAAAGCALAGALSVSLLALVGRPGTFAVLGALAVLFTAAAFDARGRQWAVRTSAGLAVGWAVALALAAARALEPAPLYRSLLVLAVSAVVALVAARPVARAPRPARVPFEAAGAGAAALAVCLVLTDLPALALVLGLCGVLAAGTAVRPDRRRVGYAAGVLFVLAAWVRLAASGVTVPEAYTLPVTVPALVVGLLRRRRDPGASSWTAYGPGLAAMLVPSLVAAWSDPHWLRPLLLGLGALAVTLAGARRRLGAPLLLGGGVLVLDGLHELAPYVVQVVDALPRWLPPALAGALLLAVGATYEKRLRDARRLREALTRMR